MEEQEIYKQVLHQVIDQSEKSQINNTDEVVKKIIRELSFYQLPKINRNTTN